MDNKLYIANNFLLTSHDYSVSIIYENKVYSIEIEKLFGTKYFGKFVSFYNKDRLYNIVLQILFGFLNENNININDLLINNINFFSDEKQSLKMDKYFIYEHHYLHACSTYYPSNFLESAILIIDDYGGSKDNKFESQTIWHGKGVTIEKLYSNKGNTKQEVAGIGRAYSKYSDFIGLEEGSIMGLSSYGNKNKYKKIKLFKFDGDNVYFDENTNLSKLYGLEEKDFIEKEINILNSKFVDIACHLQSEVEDAIVYLANKSYEKTKCRNLCLAGGVALNILANTKILKETKFENVFIQPATNDGGLSLGAVYHGYHVIGGNKKRINFSKVGIGNKYNSNQIEDEFKKFIGSILFKKSNNISKETAELISKGFIVGWFQGKNEFGPRALGNRSILADSRSINVKDRVNDIKSRQKWRPLAPVILESEVGKYFKLGVKSPYMTFSSEVFEGKKEEIPGIIHIDGTARYQTISENFNEKYYNLLKEFFSLTKVPILINTSLNVKGQPIVENPKDAIELFLSTKLDYLVIDEYIISKNELKTDFKFNSKIKNLIILKKNILDKKLYFKKWNLFKKVLLYKYDVLFTYGDGDTPISYSINKFSFIINNKTILIIELVNDNSGYFKVINDIGIKFNGEEEDNNIKLSILKIFNEKYDLIEKILKGKKQ